MNIKYLCENISLLLILAAMLTACDKEGGFTGNGPEIEWISGGTTMTYSYSSGAISAYNLKRSFTVSKESGEITIEVSVDGDNDSKVSGSFTVENGKQYGISVRGGISGRNSSSPGSSCLTAVFSSPNCRTNQEIKIDSYMVPSYNEWMQDSYYCPKTLSFGEISISE